MNKKFTKLMAALALLVFMAPSMVAWGQTKEPMTLYYETFGTTGNKTAVNNYDGYSSSLITPSSDAWKISEPTTSPCNISGSSKSCNAYCGGTSDIIFNFGSLLSTYTDVVFSFNYNKGAGNGKPNTIKCYISSDGGTTYGSDIIPSNTGSVGWYAVTNISIPDASLSNLCIKFSSSTNTNRLDDILLIGTPTVSTIITDVESFEFAYVLGGSAEYQELVIEGSNLEDDITVSVEGSGFSISEDGDTWQTTDITISQSDAEGIVAVRLDPGLPANEYNGTIILTSEGADDVTVSLTGTVSNPSYNIEQYSSPTTAHGTITFDPTSPVEAGMPVEMTATPSEGYDFVANSWVFYKESGNDFVVDNSITVTNGNTITMPFYNLYVDATFSAKPIYDITTEVTPENSGTIVTDASAWEGKEVIVMVEPANGYDFSSVVVSKTGEASTTIETQGSADDGFAFVMPAYPVTVTATFTETEIHTVAWALENTPSTGVYVQGIVSSFYNENIMGDGQNFRYYISDNGGTYNGELLVYKGKDLGNVAFNSVDDLMIGDVVTIYGDLYDYQGTKEFNAGNYIVSKTRPVHNPYNLTLPEWVNFELFAFYGLDSEPAFDYSDEEADHWGTIQVNDGTQVELSISAMLNYEIQALVVDGVDVTDQLDESGLYVFMMPDHDVTVTATATRLPYYTVTFTTNGIDDVTMEVNHGDPIGSLPTANASYIPEGYTFVGWYNGDYEVSNTAPTFITETFVPDSNVTLKAVFAQASGTVFTGTLTEQEIKSNFTNNSQAYAGDEVVYEDNIDDITWAAKGNWSAGRPWIQIRNNTTPSYIKIEAAESISSVMVTITSSSNSSGGQDDITKHTDFSGTVYLNTEANATNHVCTASDVENDVVTLNPEGNNATLYLQVSNPARIWGVTVTCGSASYSNYRTSLTESYILTIDGYADFNTKDGYYLIASPVTVDPATVEGMVVADTDPNYDYFDLYSFANDQDDEWQNYKYNQFNLVPGTGYLYAKKATTEGETFSFQLTGIPYSGDGLFELTNAGWNLVGNPFYANVTVSVTEFMVMNGDGSQIIPAESSTIAPMQGIFVYANEEGESVTFNQADGNANPNSNPSVVMNLIQNRGSVIDRAIVRFGEGNQLPKFQLFENSTELYIPQDNEDYAIVRGEAQGELPVSFRAAENGTYTLSMNVENVDMNYLHLIDNMTGMDVDLLQTPSYTFEANTNDYANRFKLVFAANGANEADEASFAFFSDGNLIVNNEGNATLQVIDINGRILSSETISGSCSKAINATTGVYMLRLINGENVKVQKVVVR